MQGLPQDKKSYFSGSPFFGVILYNTRRLKKKTLCQEWVIPPRTYIFIDKPIGAKDGQRAESQVFELA